MEEQRLCQICNGNYVENEMHVLLNCQVYQDLRLKLFTKACLINTDFNTMSDHDKFVFLFSNIDMIRLCAKTCCDILQKRPFLFSKLSYKNK